MKKLLIAIITLAGLASCGPGKSGVGEPGPIVNNTQDIRTSSDMNISPSNYTTPAPAVTKDTIEQKEILPTE